MAVGRRKKQGMSGRQLAALGYLPHKPTESTRAQVRVLVINHTPFSMICRIMVLEPEVLRYHYWRELDLAEEELKAMAAANMLALANQRADLGVAMRANELILKSRSAVWREPKQAPPEDVAKPTRVRNMTLEQVESELARIGSETDVPPGAAATGEKHPVGEGEP